MYMQYIGCMLIGTFGARFLIKSASARIVGYSEGNEEWLSLNTNPAGLIAAVSDVLCIYIVHVHVHVHYSRDH